MSHPLQVLVLAKAPVPGQVKTRLCPPCTPAQAADLAAAALHDTLAVVAATPAERRVLVLSGSLCDVTSRACVPTGFDVVPQRGTGLGARLAAAYADTARPGLGTVLVGMDTPQLTPDLLEVVGARLSRPGTDAVLAPALDGGWWCLAVRDPSLARVLSGVPMSTPETAQLTLAALCSAGARVLLAPPLQDVDTMADARVVAARAPATRFAGLVADLDEVLEASDGAAVAAADGTAVAAAAGATVSTEDGGAVRMKAAAVAAADRATVGAAVRAVRPASRPTARSAAELYGAGIEALCSGRPHGLRVREHREGCEPLPLGSWFGASRPGDDGLVARCNGPTLDIGCGPGRLSASLGARGVPVLGVDPVSAAVRSTRARGASAVRRSVFDRLPGEGRWRHLLLADGNVGIGGDPVGLLRRCAELLDPSGDALVELDHRPGWRRTRVRLEDGRRHSEWLDWAFVGPDAIGEVAAAAGLIVRERWREAGRSFAALEVA